MRKNVQRSRAFLRLFDVDRYAGRPSTDENELLRGTVVYAVAALDAFLHDLVLEIVPQFGGNTSGLKDALRAIAKDDPSLSLRMQLAPDGASRTGEFKKALGEWLDTKSFQGPFQVVNAMTYVGVVLDWADFDQATGTNSAQRLTHFTAMRHEIVHRGARQRIVRGDAEECVLLVDAIAEKINSEAVQWYRT
jgi:hypothetical protein